MDLDNLNDKEVKALINETKYFLEHARIQIPAFGKYKKTQTYKVNNLVFLINFMLIAAIQETNIRCI